VYLFRTGTLETINIISEDPTLKNKAAQFKIVPGKPSSYPNEAIPVLLSVKC